MRPVRRGDGESRGLYQPRDGVMRGVPEAETGRKPRYRTIGVWTSTIEDRVTRSPSGATRLVSWLRRVKVRPSESRTQSMARGRSSVGRAVGPRSSGQNPRGVSSLAARPRSRDASSGPLRWGRTPGDDQPEPLFAPDRPHVVDELDASVRRGRQAGIACDAGGGAAKHGRGGIHADDPARVAVEKRAKQAAGAAAEIEHRPTDPSSELAVEREVARDQVVLEVVDLGQRVRVGGLAAERISGADASPASVTGCRGGGWRHSAARRRSTTSAENALRASTRRRPASAVTVNAASAPHAAHGPCPEVDDPSMTAKSIRNACRS